MKKRIALLEGLQKTFPHLTDQEAYGLILCGEVYVEGEKVRDPKRAIFPQAHLELKTQRYVSRGGHKLEAALDAWSIPVKGERFLDAGSSTGGFTDCLLQRGALQIHAIDVGYNQIAYRLRKDPRVVLHERSNLMHMTSLEPRPDRGVLDLSFRSLVGAAAHAIALTSAKEIVALIKPQFETRRRKGFRGIITDPQEHIVILKTVITNLAEESVYATGMLPSPIEGQKGNREFFVSLSGNDENQGLREELLEKIPLLVLKGATI